jgi:hypothetical protein
MPGKAAQNIQASSETGDTKKSTQKKTSKNLPAVKSPAKAVG